MSQEYLVDTAPRPVVIGATGLAAIEQEIRFVIATMAFGVRMDCRFAGEGSYIDAPLPHAVALRIAEITEAVETYVTRVKVLSIRFAPDANAAADGVIYPVLRFALKEGVTL